MTYRDRAFACPHCGVELARYPKRDKWRCRDCVGVLAGPEEMPVELATVDWDIVEVVAPRSASLGCPGCGHEMTRLRVAGVDVDRCPREGYVWFDSGELGFLNAYFADEI